jgi:hypothetical protein
MLAPLTAIRFHRSMSVGRTGPCLLGCVSDDGGDLEVVVKFSAGCEMKERSLMVSARQRPFRRSVAHLGSAL